MYNDEAFRSWDGIHVHCSHNSCWCHHFLAIFCQSLCFCFCKECISWRTCTEFAEPQIHRSRYKILKDFFFLLFWKKKASHLESLLFQTYALGITHSLVKPFKGSGYTCKGGNIIFIFVSLVNRGVLQKEGIYSWGAFFFSFFWNRPCFWSGLVYRKANRLILFVKWLKIYNMYPFPIKLNLILDVQVHSVSLEADKTSFTKNKVAKTPIIYLSQIHQCQT